MDRRVLGPRALNRALLARQLLLERSQLPVPDALEQVAGLQTQYAPSAYIGLWSRLHDFRREQLTTALVERRAIQATLMRSTIHVVSAADFPLLAAAIRRPRREWWERVQARALRGVDMAAAAKIVRRALSDGPRSQRELVHVLDEAGMGKVAWSGAGVYLDLVRAPPSGTWERRRADLFALAEEWLPDADFEVDEETGLRHLVRRYIGGFGPAAVRDVASWAGIPPATIKRVVEALDLPVHRDENGGLLYDVPGAALPEPDTPAPVRLLPTWDANLLVHARRAQIMPERYRPIVFNTRLPPSMPTFLVDGAVAGSWRYEDGRVVIEPFEPISRSAMRELEDEAARMAEFHA